MADDQLKLADSEWAVMNAVWRDAPCSARDVHERVGGETGWAYNTVRTLLQRLVDKGALTVSRRRNQCLYAPQVERASAQKSAVRALLQKAFDGTFGGLLQHLVVAEKLSAKDRARLQELLAESDTERRR